jgi:hypothetical protein
MFVKLIEIYKTIPFGNEVELREIVINNLIVESISFFEDEEMRKKMPQEINKTPITKIHLISGRNCLVVGDVDMIIQKLNGKKILKD